MARYFDGTSNDRVNFGAVTDSIPMSVGCWVKFAGTVSTNQQLIGCNDSPAANWWRLYAEGTNVLRYDCGFSVTDADAASGSILTTDWQFVAAVCTSTTVDVYRGTTYANVAAVGSTITNPSGTHTDSSEPLIIGTADDNNFDPNADICEAFVIWGQLSLAELKMIARYGYVPRTDYELYAPLQGWQSPEMDYTGKTGTLTGTTRSAHAPILLPTEKQTPLQQYPPLGSLGLMGVGR